MAENQEQKGKKELFFERIRGKSPDLDLNDEEVLYGRINDDYNAFEQELSGYRDRERKLVDAINSNPTFAEFVSAMASGKKLVPYLIKLVGLDGVNNLVDDPEMQEEIEAANRDFAERMAKSKELDEQYKANMVESQKARDEFDEKYGEEAVDKALAILHRVFMNGLVGKTAREDMEMAINVINREADMATARDEGEIAGRNAKIEEKMRRREGGDGMPQMGGANAKPANMNRPQNIFDVAAGAY